MILGADGRLLHDVALPNPGYNGNGNGAPAAPAVGDLDGDGQLEIFVQTFDHGMDVFTVPGSAGKLHALADRPRRPAAHGAAQRQRPVGRAFCWRCTMPFRY